jgi:gas vesicle protein
MKEAHMGNGTTTFVIGLALGVLTGAAVALLYAPMTGEETRRNLKGSADRLSRRARTLYQGATDAASDLAAGGAELVDQFKDASARVRDARS